MLLGIVKRRPNEDALLPLEAVAADVCVGDPGHGVRKNTAGGHRSQIRLRNHCDQKRATNSTHTADVSTSDDPCARRHRPARARTRAAGTRAGGSAPGQARPAGNRRAARRLHPRSRRAEGPQGRLEHGGRGRPHDLVPGVAEGQHVGAALPRQGHALPRLHRQLLLPGRHRLRHPSATDHAVARRLVVPR